MKAFEILLDQDSNLKLEEQEKVLRSIVTAYGKLRQDHKVDDDIGGIQQASNDDEEKDLQSHLSHLDASLSQLTNRVEVRFYYTASSFSSSSAAAAANITRKPCYRKESARCHSYSFRFKVRRHSHKCRPNNIAKHRKPRDRSLHTPA